MESVLAKAAKIKLVIFDVDGVLTDGRIYLDNHREELKAFFIQDGLGLKLLKKTGVEIAIITSRQSNILQHRMDELGIQHVYQGHANKVVPFEKLLTALNLTAEQVAYVGDDFPDLPLIRRSGLGIAVANAIPLVKQYAAWQTTACGGQGAAREVCELIMKAQNTLTSVLEDYLLV